MEQAALEALDVQALARDAAALVQVPSVTGDERAALHALRAIRKAGARAPEVVLQGVASEEDGGLGTFAALQRDAAFDAALLPEPTGFDVVCAQAGALTFRIVVPGRSAHAADRGS